VTVLIVVVGALLMFWGAELSEAYFGRKESWAQMSKLPRDARKLAAVAALLAACAVLVAKGQPTPAEKWDLMAGALGPQVDDRSIFVHPAEVAELRKDVNVKVEVLDVRDERDFNLFHIGGSRRVSAADLSSPDWLRRMLAEPATTVTFVVGNGEAAALAAWKQLKARGWATSTWSRAASTAGSSSTRCPSAWRGRAARLRRRVRTRSRGDSFAAGERLPAAWPELPVSHRFRSPCGELQARTEGEGGGHHGVTWPAHDFTKKVKLQRKAAVKGGCG
jgi:hypothetical protein